METNEETVVYQPGVIIAVTNDQAQENGQNTESKATTAPNPRTLYRNPSEKMVAGVCGGLADFLGFDPTLVRVLWVVLTLITGGGGFLAYIALWALLPVGTVADGKLRPAAIELNDKTLARTAYLLIGLGFAWFLANIGILPQMWSMLWGIVSVLFWPAVLIGAGYLLLRGGGRNLRNDLSNVTSQVRGGMDGKVPSSDDVKGGLANARKHVPLKRSKDDRMFLGVCGGIGQRLGIDANLVRLIWAAFSVGSIGIGAILYVGLGLLLPEESSADVVQDVEAQNVQVVDGTVS